MLEAVVTTHSSGLDVILGSNTPHGLDAMPVNRLEQVFGVLRQRYRYIVVDVPNLLYAGSIRVLEGAHSVLLVCNLTDLTAVNDTCRWLEAVRSMVQQERICLVLNRVCKTSHFTVETVEKSLGLRAWASIPNDFRLVSQAANRGVPFVVSSPGHPVSQALRNMARSIIENTGSGEAEEPAGNGRQRAYLRARESGIAMAKV
jgi:pilus assembly protein CpaE